MEINEMNMEQVEARMAEIATELDAEGADIEKLSAEVDQLSQRKTAIIQAAEEKRSLLEKVASAKTEPIAKIEEREEKKMSEIEIRNTPAYMDAWKNFICTENDAECRALLTDNGGGTVPTPDLVYDTVKTAWERDGIMSRVRKTYLKGNLQVAFEASADAAIVHTEGQAVTEESLTLGVVNLQPIAIKKWISISDEAIDMTGEQFIRYIYDELTYRIAKKAADTIIAKIEALGTTAGTTAVGAPKVTAATIGLGTVAAAISNLSDEAANPVVMMNKLTWGAVKAAQYAASTPVDPFEGLDVVFNDSIKAFAVATTGETYMIVGDLGHGALANFPGGSDEITIKRDEYTLAASDLVRFIGREYVGLGIVADKAFVKVVK